MRVPGENDVLDVVIEMEDEVTQDLLTSTERKEAGEELTDDEIEQNSGLYTPPEEEIPIEETEEKKPPTAKEYRRSAEAIALGLDFTFQTGSKFVVDWRAFSKEEKQIISKNRRIFKARYRVENEGKASSSVPFFEEDENMELLYHKWASILDFFQDEMELDEDELENNVVAWQRILEYYKKEPGPWAHLITVLTATYGKRVTSILAI